MLLLGLKLEENHHVHQDYFRNI